MYRMFYIFWTIYLNILYISIETIDIIKIDFDTLIHKNNTLNLSNIIGIKKDNNNKDIYHFIKSSGFFVTYFYIYYGTPYIVHISYVNLQKVAAITACSIYKLSKFNYSWVKAKMKFTGTETYMFNLKFCDIIRMNYLNV